MRGDRDDVKRCSRTSRAKRRLRSTVAVTVIARSRLPAPEAMAAVCFTGMAGGDGKALAFISHGEWPDAVVKNQETGNQP